MISFAWLAFCANVLHCGIEDCIDFGLVFGLFGSGGAVFAVFRRTRSCFARVLSGVNENFFMVQVAVVQRLCPLDVKFFEKIFLQFGKWLYLCIRFRRKNGG